MTGVNPIILLVVGLIVVAVLANYLLKQQAAKKGKTTWAMLAKDIDGTVEGEGVKGTYEGRPVRVVVKEEKDLLMPNPFETGFIRQELGGWIYKLTMNVAPRAGSQGWTISYDGRTTTVTGLSEEFLERYKVEGRELDFAKVGAGQLIQDGHSGALTLERYFPVDSNVATRGGQGAPVPARSSFDLQLALMDKISKMF